MVLRHNVVEEIITGYSSVDSIKEIWKYLYAQFPNLKEHSISLSTVRTIFEAPNENFASSFHYCGIINARVGTKSDSIESIIWMLIIYSPIVNASRISIIIFCLYWYFVNG